jgi:hypothetical protein
MLSRRGHLVARGKFLEELDVGDQSGPREQPLEEVVTEEGALRHPPGQRLLERVDVVDPLPGIRALAEKILVDVGHCRGVRIDAGGAGEHAPEERGLAIGGQGGGDPWLKDSVSLDDAAFARLEPGPVERMRQRADEARRRAPR